MGILRGRFAYTMLGILTSHVEFILGFCVDTVQFSVRKPED